MSNQQQYLMDKRILIVDDHSLIRKGVKLILQNHLSINPSCCGEASDCSRMMAELQKYKYTHVILDIILSDGTSLEIIPNIKQLYPHLRIMVFSMLSKEVYGEALKQYNILHFLHKTTCERETIKFFKDFMNEENPQSITTESNEHNPFATLSSRELEVLHYMFNGYGTKEISNILNLRMSTVSTIKGRIFDKTTTKNLKDLMQLGSLYNINYM